MDEPRDTPTDSQRWVADRATPIMAVLVVLALACAAAEFVKVVETRVS